MVSILAEGFPWIIFLMTFQVKMINQLVCDHFNALTEFFLSKLLFLSYITGLFFFADPTIAIS